MEQIKNIKFKKTKGKVSPFNLIFGILLALYALTIFFTIYFVLVSAFKTVGEFENNFFGLPINGFTLENIELVLGKQFPRTREDYQVVLKIIPDILIYSVLYVVGGAFCATFIPCITAYFAAKFDYKFSKLIYVTVVVVMIVPIVGNLPSMLNVLRTLNLYDTIYGGWIMRANFVNMYFLVFFAIFQGVPKDYSEAAYIDGASEFTVMARIILPLVKTTFTTVMLVQFVHIWNDYQTPLLYFPSHPTIAWAVYSLSITTETGFASAPRKMAACFMMVLPTAIIFIFFRKKLMGNLTMGGIKG